MQTHDLKTWPEYYALVADGSKRFELRQDDRGFAVGDTLILREYEPTTLTYSGRVTRARVTCIVRNGPWLSPGYAALGFEVIE